MNSNSMKTQIYVIFTLFALTNLSIIGFAGSVRASKLNFEAKENGLLISRNLSKTSELEKSSKKGDLVARSLAGMNKEQLTAKFVE